MSMKRATTFTFALAILGASVVVLPVSAHAPSGAIFTTLSDGSEVNVNQFASKEDVYLDGGPGPGAPATAAGLDAGTYVFQVTDPSGKTLLSTDPASCRQFTVSGGLITGVAPAGACAHNTGTDVDHSATTVQLFPYNDTPNPGGVYKAWVVRVEDFLAGCAALGVNNGLAVVNCGRNPGNLHGFVPAHSKTDNFKVKEVPIREIDTLFIHRNTGELLSGRNVTWVDTLGASNSKWSYLSTFWNIIAAHVEAVEDGEHQIVVADQPGCTVQEIYLREERHNGISRTYVGSGPQTVPATIRSPHALNVVVEVYCDP